MFDSGILSWNGEKVKHTINQETYQKLKSWYLNSYKKLANLYMNKENADNFLFNFAKKDGEYFMPKEDNLHEFATWYYKMYEEYGNKIDETDSPENYRPKIINQ